MKRAVATALACALLAAGGCSSLEGAPAPVSARSGGGEALAGYLAKLRTMNETALSAEAARQKSLASREPGDLARVRAALALSLAPHADESEILALVEPVAGRQNAPADLRGMASFLQAMATDRRRLRESAEKQAGRQGVALTVDMPVLGRLYEYEGTFEYRVEPEGG